jgi:hypothetical protein
MELLYLILGWLFGLLSQPIINRINKSYTKRELLEGIKTEIKECQFRVVLVAYTLGDRFGKCDKELLKWCLPYLQNYHGAEPTENHIKAIKSLLNCKDEELENALTLTRSMDKGKGVSLKKFHLPFLDSKMNEISFFSIELQNIIYEIRSRLQIINEEIGAAERYFYMTFDSSISDKNYIIIEKNLIQKYINLQTQLVILVKKMDNCLNYKILSNRVVYGSI